MGTALSLMKFYPRRFKRLLRAGKVLDYLKGQGRFILPSKDLEEIFEGCKDTCLTIPAGDILASSQDSMIVPSGGLVTLAAICQQRKPRKIFEIGTYRGTSTRVMAMNTPADAHIYTLDLDPKARPTHKHGTGVGGFSDYIAGDFCRNTTFASKVTQLYGDSKTFNFTPYYGHMDIVFVDADHTYEFVKADSEQAFKLIRPGGVIVWDDYRWTADHPECAGVADYLHQEMHNKEIIHIRGTRFAAYHDSGERL